MFGCWQALLVVGGAGTDTERSASQPTGVPMPTTQTGVAPAGTGRRPREDEIDAHGLTHPGKVRRDSQDHYLLCSLRRQIVVRGSSIPHADAVLGTESERLASMAMVADGVGGAAKGETASRVALT